MIPQMEPWFDEKETNALLQYMNSGGWLTEHTKTREFEERIAQYTGAKHCIVVPNGTAALFLALKAVGIGQGSEVIVPDFTMVATANAVVMTGATPIFVDVGDDLCLNLDLAKAALTHKTDAILYVNLDGRASRLEEWLNLSCDYGIPFIEDAAQSLGSRYDGKHLGTWGDIGILSFSVPKIISTGQGGALLTDDDDAASRIRAMKDFGRERAGADHYLTMGWNFKFTDLQAVVGIEQMKKLPWRVERKKEMYQLYRSLLVDTTIKFIETDLENTSPWFIDILVENRDGLMNYLKSKEIGTRPFYPALHSEPAYRLTGDYPMSQYAAGHGLWLPSSVKLTNSEIERVCDAIKEYDLHYR